MSVRVQVIGSNDRPVVGAEVFVKWSAGGHSSRTTNQYGIADLECTPGTADEVLVNGRPVVGRMWLEDGINPVSER